MKFRSRKLSQLPLIFALSLNVILANPAHSQEPTESKTTASGLSTNLGKDNGGAGAGSSSSSKKRKRLSEDGESDSSSDESKTKKAKTETKKAKTEAAANPFQKINDYLYVGKKDGIFFVMERIDKGVPDSGDRLKFWEEYAMNENVHYENYKDLWREGKLPKEKGFLQFEGEGLNDELNWGLGSFEISIQKFHSNNELWICYATPKEIKSASEISEHEIEMVVSVLSTEDSPFVTHIGITRSFRYLFEAAEEVVKLNHKSTESSESKEPKAQLETERDFPLHPNLSTNLHAFSAKVMKMRDASKVYMITCPLRVMRDIIDKALPEHAFSDDTFEWAKEIILETKEDSLEAADKQIKANAISYLAETLEVTPKTSPIRRTQDWIEIFDKERKAVIYRHDFNSNEITVKGKVLRGNETERFGWFRHEDMVDVTSYLTVHLDELAELFDREQLPRKTK